MNDYYSFLWITFSGFKRPLRFSIFIAAPLIDFCWWKVTISATDTSCNYLKESAGTVQAAPTISCCLSWLLYYAIFLYLACCLNCCNAYRSVDCALVHLGCSYHLMKCDQQLLYSILNLCHLPCILLIYFAFWFNHSRVVL